MTQRGPRKQFSREINRYYMMLRNTQNSNHYFFIIINTRCLDYCGTDMMMKNHLNAPQKLHARHNITPQHTPTTRRNDITPPKKMSSPLWKKLLTSKIGPPSAAHALSHNIIGATLLLPTESPPTWWLTRSINDVECDDDDDHDKTRHASPTSKQQRQHY